MESLLLNRQFVLYKTTPSLDRPGKTDKKPCDQNGHEIRWSDTSLWLTGEQARDQSSLSGYGLGFIFTKEDDYFFIDIDNCLQADNTWSPTALNILSRFNGAYVEISQSGKGLHIIAKGKPPVHKCRNTGLGIELYTHSRFVALTGTGAIGSTELNFTNELTQFVNDYLVGVGHEYQSVGSLWEDWGKALIELPHHTHTVITDDNELITKACTTRSADSTFGGKASFYDLWNNDEDKLAASYINAESGQYDRSAADAALAQLLCFWTGNDAARIDRLMRESALYRDKYDRADYLPRTILKSRSRQTTFYSRDYSLTQKQGTSHSDERGGNNIIPLPPSQVPLSRTPLTKAQYLIQTDNFKPVSCKANLEQLLSYYGITVRWNLMKHQREIVRPGYIPSYGNEENIMLSEMIDLAGENNLPITRIDEQLDVIAWENKYHPIVQCVTEKPWDGIPRLKQFLGNIKTKNDTFSHLLIYRWMLSAMAAALSEEGFSQQGVLVLEGAQGINKTSWIRALDPIKSEAVKEGSILDPTNKDNLISHFSHWIVEIAELGSTKRKTDNDILKAHITTKLDNVRFPFARKVTKIPRRTSYIATVNDAQFLNDVTGNRRWWAVSVLEINLDHGLDMQQVWAEVAYWLSKGEQTWLSNEEMENLNTSNETYEVIDPLEEELLNKFDWESDWKGKPSFELNATSVLKLLGYSNPARYQANVIGRYLTKYAIQSHKRRHHLLPKLKTVT